MLIVIEGNDGTGKSTVAKLLADDIFAPLYKPVGTPIRGLSVQESQAEDRGAWGVATLLPHDIDLIFDRAFPSEYAYGKAFERGFDERQVWELDEAVSKLVHVAFYIEPITSSYGLHEMTAERWARVTSFYEEYIERSKMDWVRVKQWPNVVRLRKEISMRRPGTGVHRVTMQP